MANTLSALKRARQTERQTTRNRTLKTSYKTLRKKVVATLESGDKAQAEEQYRLYASALDRAAKANVIHKNSADRHKSRIAKRMTAGS